MRQRGSGGLHRTRRRAGLVLCVLVDHRAGEVTERTPEQVAADNALEDAIAAGIRAYDLTDEGSIVTTWAVLGASQGVDEGESSYFQLYPSGSQARPRHRWADAGGGDPPPARGVTDRATSRLRYQWGRSVPRFHAASVSGHQ